jgi:hypothetical protein
MFFSKNVVSAGGEAAARPAKRQTIKQPRQMLRHDAQIMVVRVRLTARQGQGQRYGQ